MGLMAVADFVWVQFYNNYCDIGTSYFISSVQQWSSELAAQNSDTRLFLGVIGWAAGGSGYASPASLTSAIQSIKALSLPNFGGAMTWGTYKSIIATIIQADQYFRWPRSTCERQFRSDLRRGDEKCTELVEGHAACP